MTGGTAFVMVTTTVASRPDAQTMAHALVDARLAACVQITPIDSVYRWQDAIETTAECLLLIKARMSDVPAIEAAIRERHTYEVPEIVAVPIVAGASSYLDWMSAMTTR